MLAGLGTQLDDLDGLGYRAAAEQGVCGHGDIIQRRIDDLQ